MNIEARRVFPPGFNVMFLFDKNILPGCNMPGVLASLKI